MDEKVLLDVQISCLFYKDTFFCKQFTTYSPDIKLYKKDTQEWVPIQYSGGDNEYMTDRPTGEVVLQFEMPSPRMQC